jgi:hypothetical protein
LPPKNDSPIPFTAMVLSFNNILSMIPFLQNY